MTKSKIRLFLCIILLFPAVVLSACANETVALQARIDALEADKADLQSTISSMQTEFERVQTDLFGTRNELQIVLVALEEAEKAASQDNQNVELAITYGNVANTDMSWPLDYGELLLGLRINLNNYDDDVEIVWRSENENIFTVISIDKGTSATVTPLSVGSAELVVTVGDEETRSWVRIT
ncbi:MAG: hypothetical protein LBD23_14200 [Oscillospiraceae bacterium]|jgi:allophanate hydrolase subunit 1|nr:hypothetical protein [Oscillospiraceae bacterium]